MKYQLQAMNKLPYILLVLISISLVKLSIAQKRAFHGKEITLHNFMFAITDEFQPYREYLEENNSSDAFSAEKDPVAELFMHKSYERIKAAIEQKTGLKILPVETLKGKVAYDIYDYPFGGKKKAAKKGNTPYYLKLNIQMSARDMINEEVGINSSSFEKRKIKAHVAIKATIYNNFGKEFYVAKGKAKGDRWIVLDQMSLAGFIFIEGKNVVDEQATLLSVLDEAIEDLKANFP